MQNLFWPIYKQLEKEFKELSFYITIDKRQLKTYSIKIADLLLRTVSECENIAKSLCKREGVKFKDKKGKLRKVVYMNEYIEQLDIKFNLKDKLISFTFENVVENTFAFKQTPFRKVKKVVNGKEKEIWSWYHAYNQIKHDRARNFKESNIENLIEGLAALFMLNIYYKDEVFYSNDNYDVGKIVKNIKSFSDVFSVDYIVKLNNINELDGYRYGDFFSPKSYWEACNSLSIYIIEFDKEHKTSSDRGADFAEKIKGALLVLHEDGSLTKLHENYFPKEHKTICKIVASINRIS